jgi:hypothetical protein
VVLLILGLYHLLDTEDLRGRDERKRPDECWRSASTYGEQNGAESSDLEGNSYCSRIVPGFVPKKLHNCNQRGCRRAWALAFCSAFVSQT